VVHEKIDMETESLRQMVYTVPKEDRQLFMSRAKLNGLIRSAEKISKHFFPDRKQIAIPHLFGDPHDENPDNDLEYNPHINILTIEPKQTRLKLSPEGLKAINKAWQKALKGHGCLHADIVDIHYSFREKAHHIGHSIKYMTRPTWGERQLISGDQKMRKFLTLDLKGFSYIRYFDRLAHCKYDESVEMTGPERETIESVTGERWMKIGYDKNINFKLRVEKDEMEELLHFHYTYQVPQPQSAASGHGRTGERGSGVLPGRKETQDQAYSFVTLRPQFLLFLICSAFPSIMQFIPGLPV
jgi:hypothetical protein